MTHYAPSLLALAAFAGAATGCGTLGTGDSLGLDGGNKGVRTILPNKTLHLAPSVQIPLEGLLLGAALYWYVDPLAPNWQVGETALAPDRYRIALKQKPFVSGGEGEADMVFKRRAEQLARDHGRAGYVILDYHSGVESALPLSYRVANGTVLLR